MGVRKGWFVMRLAVFMLSQVILPKSDNPEEKNIRITILVCRCITFGIILPRLAFSHTVRIFRACYSKDTVKALGCIPLPKYLSDPYEFGALALTCLLSAMVTIE